VDRIFTATMGTQLLVIQHLRRHLPATGARDFLLWHPFENIAFVDTLMRKIIAGARFADTLDLRGFASLQPRTQGPVTWLFETTRRLRSDAARLRKWMVRNHIDEDATELWVDDPIHFNVLFARGTLRRMRHVKIPHAFNHEDATMPEWKATLDQRSHEGPWLRRRLFLPWQRWSTGVDLNPVAAFDRAYSFDRPSPWAAESIDASALISLDAFAATYATLPDELRGEVDAALEPIRAAPRPLVVLLLFGLRPGPGPDLVPIYRSALQRIFAERADELRGCTVAVKAHPAATGDEEEQLIAALRDDLPARVLPLLHGLNLELMLPQLRPEIVMAGLCGALPIVRRLGDGRPVAIAEMVDAYLAEHAEERNTIGRFLEGIEIW
jgi:hypothetical protein